MKESGRFKLLTRTVLILLLLSLFQGFHLLYPKTASAGLDQWTPVSGGYGIGVTFLYIHPPHPSLMYAGTSTVQKSIDGGLTWSKIAHEFGSVNFMAVNSVNPDIVYIGQYDDIPVGLFKSIDGGMTWSGNIAPVGSIPRTVAIDPQHPNTLYLATDSGVYKSIDGGQSWRHSSNGMDPNYYVNIWVIEISSTNPDIIYAGARVGGIYKSEDSGATWRNVGGPWSPWLITIDPSDPHVIYSSNYSWQWGGGLFKINTLTGRVWVFYPTETRESAIHALAVNPYNPNILFASVRDRLGHLGVYRSDNGGTTWNHSPGSLFFQVFAIHPIFPHLIYAPYNNLWVYQDSAIPYDNQPPTTGISLQGTLGENNWYISDVQVALTAIDNEGGSGVKEIHYIIDAQETVAPGDTSTLTLSAEGINEITYWAVDNAGNIEPQNITIVKIDKTGPEINILSPVGTISIIDPLVSVTMNDLVSGVASYSYFFDGNEIPNTTASLDLAYLSPGEHTFQVTAIDNAGNIATVSSTFIYSPTTSTLNSLLDRMYADGEITKLGTSLYDKLDDAQAYIDAGDYVNAKSKLSALIHQIEAQIDIHVTEYAGNILIADINYLISTLL